MRMCIVGHAGVGKSPFSKVFKLQGWEPYRVREPRDAEDAKVCKTPHEYEALLRECREKQKPHYDGGSSSQNHLLVYDQWSFFKVRNDRQCLELTPAAKDASQSLRVEIFAPVLVEMIENRTQIASAFPLDLDDLAVVILNPDSTPISEMASPSLPLTLATHTAVAERSRAQGKPTDLPDILKRVDYLAGELKAWQDLQRIVPDTVECRRWKHFEYRYSTPRACLANAQAELIRARDTLVKAVEEQATHLVAAITPFLRSDAEILKLTTIV
jgi:hypothetical protein